MARWQDGDDGRQEADAEMVQVSTGAHCHVSAGVPFLDLQL